MIDTLIIRLPTNKLTDLKTSDTYWRRASTSKGYQKLIRDFYSKPPRLYLPKVSVFVAKQKYLKSFVQMEFSATKIVFNNNLEELEDTDLEKLLEKLQEKLKGAREEVYIDQKKRNPTDFALWFKRIGRFKNHTMHWNSPWGDGFPGWLQRRSAFGGD